MVMVAMGWSVLARPCFYRLPPQRIRLNPRVFQKLPIASPISSQPFSISPRRRTEESDQPALDSSLLKPDDKESGASDDSKNSSVKGPTLISPEDFRLSLKESDRHEYDALSSNEREEYQLDVEETDKIMADPAVEAEINSMIATAAQELEAEDDQTEITPPRVPLEAFGGLEEEDSKEWPADEEFEEDDMTSLAHGELEQHREIRHYARIAAWEMPLLSRESNAPLPESDPRPRSLTLMLCLQN